MSTPSLTAIRLPIDSTNIHNALFGRLWSLASSAIGTNVAISDARSTLTYAQLAQRSMTFAEELREAGVQAGDPVGVLLGNSREFLIATFGIWKHGAVLVPLNPQLREQELIKSMHDCGLRSLVTSARNHSLIEAIEDKGARLERLWLCPLDRDEWIYRGGRVGKPANPTERVTGTSEQAALIQYSTGSTGHAKRITRSDAMLLRESTSVAGVLGVTSSERVLGVAPFFHSHGLMNSAMLALLSGASLHVVHSFLPRDVARLIAREGITGFPGVPFMFDLLNEPRDAEDFTSIRFAISAGAPLPVATAEAFARKYGVRIRQLYGTTETGVIAIQSGDAGADIAAVGRPVPGVSVRIVNERREQVAAGTVGRVEITSSFAATAYDNTAGNEECRFEHGVFFPGDLGRLSANGELTLCGRHRGFINVGGSKVDPSEIEAVLRELPGVDEAVVFGVPDGAAGEKIKAVVASSTGITREAVRMHCAEHLAEFKVPKIVECRKELPKSPLGKILRKYLMDEAAEGQPRTVFDPTRGFRIVPESDLAPPDTIEMATLPPFLRVLLVTDGTVTKSIEAHFWEPVDVEVLEHASVPSERARPGIGVHIGDLVLRRCVILRGRITRSAYAFAESIIAHDRVPAAMSSQLIQGAKGIGELLREEKTETYRELVAIRRAQAGELALHLGVDGTAPVVAREYTIRFKGQAAMVIEEVFAVSRFDARA